MISERLMETAVKYLLSNLPPEAQEQLAICLRAGVELKAQLDRVETRLAAMELALQFIARREFPTPSENLITHQENGHDAGRIESDVTQG